MGKRIFCLVLAAMMAFAAGAAAQEEKAYTLAGFDDTQYRNWETNLFFERMEKATGIRFEKVQYKKAAEWTAYKASLEKGQDMPDVLFKAGLTGAECISLYEAGVLVDLKPYLEENCPNLWAYLTANPEALEAVTLPGGQIVALPYISQTPVQNYIWVNMAWLEKTGKKMPENAAELEDVLAAFRDMDLNKNGKADEIPLSFMGPFDLKFLAHAFGMTANDYNLYVKEGQVRFLPFDEQFRPFLEWCRDMYANGLLEKDGFILSTAMRSQQVQSAEDTPIYGMIITPMAQDVFRNAYGDNYDILMPLEFNGSRVYRDFSGTVLRGTFAVTSACEDVEKMLGWVDYLYSPEGNILMTAGIEKEDYFYNADGTWSLTQATEENTYFTIMALISGGATAPGLLNEEFQRNYADSKKMQKIMGQQDAFKQYLVQPFPYYTLTEEQQRRADEMQTLLGPCVDRMMGRFIKGEVELTDETYNAFLEELRTLGADEFVAFWQQVLGAQ